MSHKTFHVHGAAEVRLTVLQNRDTDEVIQENPQKPGEKDADYEARIEALLPKRVDFHIFHAEDFLPGSMQALFDDAANGHKIDRIHRNGKLVKTQAEIESENPKAKDEPAEKYQARIKDLFDKQ